MRDIPISDPELESFAGLDLKSSKLVLCVGSCAMSSTPVSGQARACFQHVLSADILLTKNHGSGHVADIQ